MYLAHITHELTECIFYFFYSSGARLLQPTCIMPQLFFIDTCHA